MDDILNLSEIAKTLIESDAKNDLDICKMTILFPLIETFGYDAARTGDIFLNPAYTEDGEYKLDYGLRGETDESIKTVIKVIEYNAEPGLEFAKIRQSLATIDHVEYVVITDCFNYYIYANTDDDSTFLDVLSFNIAEIDNEQIRLLGVLQNPAIEVRQQFAIDFEQDDDRKNSVSKYEKSPKDLKQIENDKEKSSVKRNISPWIVPIVFASVCICMLITTVLFALYYRSDSSNWYQITFKHNSYSLDYYTLAGNVNISTYQDKLSTVNVTLSESNLPEGVNVTVILENQYRPNDKQIHNVITNVSGGFSEDIPLPAGWINCDINVTARVDFNDNQTAIAKTQYGTGGSKIIEVGNKDKFLIGVSQTYYDHTAIEAYIKLKQEQEAAAQLQAIKDYFGGYTIQKYSNGDMCFYPKGYNTDDWPSNSDATNINITSSNKAYAKIYYHADTNTAEFYFVIGTLMKSAHFWSAGGSFVLSNTVQTYSLSTKSGNFYQHVNPMTSITGWCVFTQTGVGDLISILESIYSSDQSTVEFKGLNEKIRISAADKNAVMSILDLYWKYFASGSISLDPRWFQ